MKIVFFGTPSIAVRVLSFLCENQRVPIALVTQPDRGVEKSFDPNSSVAKWALHQGWKNPLYRPEKASDLEMIEILRNLQPDLFVTVAYGQILKQALLDVPRLGCINVHASYLPQYRGAAPMQRALMAGEKETGVTIMKMVLKMDAGDILDQVKVPIELEDTRGDLEDKLATVAGPLLLQSLVDIERGKTHPKVQDESRVTFAKKIEPQECFIDWNRKAIDIHNQIRALSPTPSAFCYILCHGEKKRLKIKRSRPNEKIKGPFGTAIMEKERLFVTCQDGAIEILEAQLEGKKSLSIKEFLQGVRSSISILNN